MRPLNQKQTIKRILRQLKGYTFYIILSVLMAVITVAGSLLVPIFFGDAINYMVEGATDWKHIFSYFALIGVSIAFTCASQWLLNIINNKITYSVTQDIRREAFEHIQKLPLKYLDAHPYGDIVSRNVADVDQFADGLLMGFTQFFTGILTIVSTLVMMFVLNWIIALAVFVLTPLSLFIAKFVSTKTYKLFRKNSQIRGEQTAFIDEMVGNLKVVQAFSHEDENSEKFDEINERLTKASQDATFFSSLPNPTTRFVNALVYAAVALAGALTIIFPTSLPFTFNVGKLSTLLSYANQYTKPFNEITGVITELQNAIACAGRIYELIDQPLQVPDAPNAEVLEKAEGNVDFRDVCFSYSEDRKLIENFNISVKAGQHIAIVGPTGCGKTTLINLLMRFYDVDEGAVCVDGKDIRDITRHSLRKNYGMVLQDTWLKNGTIKQNIMLGKPDATDEEVIEAAKNAHAHKFIMQLENGYDTYITEDGGNLSQGQKQLLCITRIMLSLPPMLILDEATSSIDTRTEMQIQQAFAVMMKGRTCFIVAHRLSTVKNADLIIVMKDGKIIEQGRHEELLELGGFYNKLYNSQFAV